MHDSTGSGFDEPVAAAEGLGLRIFFILDYGNPLYGETRAVIDDEGRRAFSAFAATVASRYGGRGHAWEIWNEPNLAQFWTSSRGGPAPRLYADLVRATAAAIRRADPHGKIVAGALFFGFAEAVEVLNLGIGGPRFLEALAATDVLGLVNAVSLHFHRFGAPESAPDDIERARGILAGAGHSLPLWSGDLASPSTPRIRRAATPRANASYSCRVRCLTHRQLLASGGTQRERTLIDLYTAPTPNGWKVSIALEELQLPYEVHVVNLLAGDQKRPEYLRLNPNGRIPTIVDRDAGDFAVFESGAILIYLAEKTGRLMPSDPKGRSRAIQWLMFQMAGVGPMMGQANVFYRYFPEKIQPAIDRYQNECRRLFEVLDTRLAAVEWLAGEYSIADIANWSWVRTYKWSGVPIDGLTNLRRWMDQMSARPACQKGVKVPFEVPNLTEAASGQSAEEFARAAGALVQR